MLEEGFVIFFRFIDGNVDCMRWALQASVLFWLPCLLCRLWWCFFFLQANGRTTEPLKGHGDGIIFFEYFCSPTKALLSLKKLCVHLQNFCIHSRNIVKCQWLCVFFFFFLSSQKNCIIFQCFVFSRKTFTFTVVLQESLHSLAKLFHSLINNLLPFCVPLRKLAFNREKYDMRWEDQWYFNAFAS